MAYTNIYKVKRRISYTAACEKCCSLVGVFCCKKIKVSGELNPQRHTPSPDSIPNSQCVRACSLFPALRLSPFIDMNVHACFNVYGIYFQLAGDGWYCAGNCCVRTAASICTKFSDIIGKTCPRNGAQIRYSTCMNFCSSTA
jgi:hypothetical protein